MNVHCLEGGHPSPGTVKCVRDDIAVGAHNVVIDFQMAFLSFRLVVCILILLCEYSKPTPGSGRILARVPNSTRQEMSIHRSLFLAVKYGVGFTPTWEMGIVV